MPQSRNLLVCLDAFGTLFAPRRPVAQQYGEVARALGLSGFTDDDVKRTFKAAFKHEAAQHPNYGRAQGMNAQHWWTNIITNTFKPLIGPHRQLPSELVPQLLQRFWSEEGYVLLPGAVQLLHRLRELRRSDQERRIVVGVITNSDDRVPNILTSLGLSVGPVRFGDGETQGSIPSTEYDIDFVIMSFDVGHEKPDRRLFAAAVDVSKEKILPPTLNTDVDDSWKKIYVGDEYDKDVVGASSAGWHAVLIGQNDPRVKWLEDVPPRNLEEVLVANSAVGFADLGRMAEWL